MNSPDDGQRAVNYVSFNPSKYDGKDFVVSYVLNVAEEGDYKLTAIGSLRSQTYTSDWKFYVDDETNAVTTYKQVGDVNTTFLKTLFKEYDCGMIHLKKGINTLCWKVDEADAPNGVLQAAMDYFVLLPTVSLENPSLKVNDKIKKGESAGISIINGDGSELALDLFQGLSVSFDDDRIAMWKDGKVFAANYGSTKVTVTLKDMKGNSHTVTKDVMVISEQGIWINKASVESDGSINVEIGAMQEYRGSDQLIAVVYDTVNGMPTSIVSASEYTDIPSIPKDGTKTVSLQPGSVNEAQEVAIYILSGDDTKKAIYRKYVFNR